MSQFKFARRGRCYVLIHGRGPPEDCEWDQMLGSLVMRDNQIPKLRALTITAGGAPTTLQRKRLIEVLRGNDLKNAVVTDLRTVRLVVTAISWFNQGLRAFAPGEIQTAVGFLGLSKEEADYAITQARALAKDIGVDGLGLVPINTAIPR